MAKSIKRNTVLNIIKTCSSILYPLIAFPYVSRILLPDNVGKVDYARSFVSYFALIASLGVLTYAVRECAAASDNREELSRVSSQIISINICTTVVAYVLLFIVLFFTHGLDEYGAMILIYSSTIVFTTLGADWLNTAMEDFPYITARTVLFQVISIAAMLLFVRERDDYFVYISILALSSSGANIANIRYRRRYCDVHFTWNMELKKHIKPIMLLFVMTLSQTVFNNADITMLGVMKGDYDVGIYSTAFKVITLIANVVQSIILVILPRLSYYFANNDYDAANRLLRKLLGFNITLGLPISVGTFMLSNDIAWVVGGEEFLAAGPVLKILVFSFAFSLVGGSFLGNAVLIPTKREGYYMIVCCITAVVNVAINALLIPKLGAIGAAIATAGNGLSILLLLLLKVDKKIKIERKLAVFVGPVVGSAVIVLCCMGCSIIQPLLFRVMLSVALSVIVYTIILLALKNEFVTEIIDTILIKTHLRKPSAMDSTDG